MTAFLRPYPKTIYTSLYYLNTCIQVACDGETWEWPCVASELKVFTGLSSWMWWLLHQALSSSQQFLSQHGTKHVYLFTFEHRLILVERLLLTLSISVQNSCPHPPPPHPKKRLTVSSVVTDPSLLPRSLKNAILVFR
jgi:hypothetical protein